ncbi:unnamed protein product [Staurois parvus]|uniref:Uncharacterized protein n=1 Tax=Staurois parvus TaxID=386267 RepID=A0ABN9CB53_9NEOB|nr:unnamed protein product [Staurois parvus]
METAAMGGRTGDPMRDSGPGSSMRRRYRGPWQIRGLAAAMGEARNLPAPYDKKLNTPAVVMET